jgi:hypothetical protein
LVQGDAPISALHDAPPEPYVRAIREARARSHVHPWHIAVRLLENGQAMVRCQVDPLTPPIEWRSIPPEVSLDAEMCTPCLNS